jgi:primosomal protein N' (replication factor Y)
MNRSDQYVHVAIDRPAEALDRYFTYRLPPSLVGQVQVGSYVLVPFGREQVPSFVLELSRETAEEEPKEIAGILSDFPLFDASLLELARRIAAYYHCSLVEVLRCLVPEGIGREVEHVITWTGPDEPASWAEKLAKSAPRQGAVLRVLAERGGQASVRELKKALHTDSVAGPVHSLRQKGLVEERYLLQRPPVRAKTVPVATVARSAVLLDQQLERLQRRAPKQAQVLQTLIEQGGRLEVAELVRRCQVAPGLVRQLEEKGLIEIQEVEVRRAPRGGLGAEARDVVLNPEQEKALALILQSLERRERRPILLYGVTASGKTEVYMRAIAHVLDKGGQCIVLVPEISLTAQVIDLFRSRFGDRVAILHSALSPGERFDEWRRIQTGEADIVVGPRSALFAPCRRLRLIILDEEHETSYKQDATPRYHARRVACWRAQLVGATLVLGSATPSVESFYQAQQGGYLLARMVQRVEERPLAQVEIVDMREEECQPHQGPLSQRLIEAMRERLQRREQILLFLNRRGFSTFILCRECGTTLFCPNCEVSLVLHLESWEVRCHHCDLRGPVPEVCPTCRGSRLGYLGFGTERVVEFVQEALPEARILRMDRDTTGRKDAHAEILGRFQRHEADILVGTQMIAKGLDFPNVTLVGVIAADLSLNVPEFRAAERTFQLLTQVSGRAGRGPKAGLVVVQTYCPDHYAIRTAQQQDFEAFYREEIEYRRELQYPPFSVLANVVVTHADETTAQEYAERIAHGLRASFLQLQVGGSILGPAPAPLARLRGLYRWHLLVKAPRPGRLQKLLARTLRQLPPEMRQSLTVDVDPVNMM